MALKIYGLQLPFVFLSLLHAMLTKDFKADGKLDNKVSVHPAIGNSYTKSLINCTILSRNSSECFSFNSQTGMCRRYCSCDPSDMTVTESGWRLYNNLSPEWMACPGSWVQYAGHCYCAVKNSQKWRDARNTCSAMNAHLVEIESQAEQNWIHEKLTKENCWIGLTDEGSEGVWYWEHSRYTPNFKGWKPGQPEGGIYENCGILSPVNNWHDFPYDRLYSFVCEK